MKWTSDQSLISDLFGAVTIRSSSGVQRLEVVRIGIRLRYDHDAGVPLEARLAEPVLDRFVARRDFHWVVRTVVHEEPFVQGIWVIQDLNKVVVVVVVLFEHHGLVVQPVLDVDARLQ